MPIRADGMRGLADLQDSSLGSFEASDLHFYGYANSQSPFATDWALPNRMESRICPSIPRTFFTSLLSVRHVGSGHLQPT